MSKIQTQIAIANAIAVSIGTAFAALSDDAPVDHWVTIDGSPVPITSGGGGGSKGGGSLTGKQKSFIEKHVEQTANRTSPDHAVFLWKNELKTAQHDIRTQKTLLKHFPGSKNYEANLKEAQQREAVASHAIGHAEKLKAKK